jgi:hypothetical protein
MKNEKALAAGRNAPDPWIWTTFFILNSSFFIFERVFDPSLTA